MKKFAFPRSARLRLRKNFDFVFNKGKKTHTRDLALWSALPEDGGTGDGRKRMGLVLSRKVGGAVRRNRLKRLLREAFRLSKDGLKDGAEIIVYPKQGCGINNLLQARAALAAAWSRAKIRNADK